jgi:hypothetical protein
MSRTGKHAIAALASVATDPVLLEVARKAIEDRLIDLRNSRIALVGRGNGLVVYEADGTPSRVIRLGPEDAVCVGLLAVIDHLKGAL